MSEIVPVPGAGNAFLVTAGTTEQSWVYLDQPLLLEFEYVQRIAEALEATVLTRPATERIRVVHVGGGGLTLPRYLAARRPHSAQIVLEPDTDLIEQVRSRLPLPPNSGIKIRPIDGLAGIAEMPDDYADAIILDAFNAARIPGELATLEYFADLARVLRPAGVMIMNLTGKSPFDWVRRALAGLAETWPKLAVSAETPVWKGRRFGNFVAVASATGLPVDRLDDVLARAAFPHRLVYGATLKHWIGRAQPFTEATAQDSIPFEPWL
ncbi:MAG: fused MFS/spermidine synthase [Propionibacteriaceae bacterium]|nr:fused MFS/spermidine synthase [Propionibacteriaceae bacterium]